MKSKTPYWKFFLPFLAFLTLYKFGGGLHYSILAPFGEKVFPLWIVGLLIGGSAFLQLLLDVPAGYLLDKYGYRKLLIVTTLFFVAASLCFLLGATKFSYILTMIISTFGWLFFGPGINAYTLIEAPAKKVGEFSAAKDVFTSIGIVLSSIAMIYVVNFDIKIVGLILFIIFALAFLAILYTPEEKIHNEERVPEKCKNYLTRRFWEEIYHSIKTLKPVSILLITTGFSSSVFYAIIWFVVPLLLAHSAKTGMLGLGLGIFDFSTVILGFALGKMVDTFNKKLLIIIGLVVFALSGTFLGFNFGFLFILLGFIAASGDELTSLSLWAWLYEVDKDKQHYGLISGIIGLFEDLGWAIGPIAAGILYGIIGPTFTIGVGGILIFLNLVIFYLFLGHKIPKTLSLGLIPKKPSRSRHKQ